MANHVVQIMTYTPGQSAPWCQGWWPPAHFLDPWPQHPWPHGSPAHSKSALSVNIHKALLYNICIIVSVSMYQNQQVHTFTLTQHGSINLTSPDSTFQTSTDHRLAFFDPISFQSNSGINLISSSVKIIPHPPLNPYHLASMFSHPAVTYLTHHLTYPIRYQFIPSCINLISLCISFIISCINLTTSCTNFIFTGNPIHPTMHQLCVISSQLLSHAEINFISSTSVLVLPASISSHSTPSSDLPESTVSHQAPTLSQYVSHLKPMLFSINLPYHAWTLSHHASHLSHYFILH